MELKMKCVDSMYCVLCEVFNSEDPNNHVCQELMRLEIGC